MSVEQVPLAGGLIDRDAATRGSAELLERAWEQPGTVVLRVAAQSIPIRDRDGVLALVSAREVDAPVDERIYLGLHDGAAVFAIAAEETESEPGVTWQHVLTSVLRLPPAERELVTMALAVIRWHEAAGFSPRDGEPTTVADGGWSRRTAAGGELFPRTDPAVIVLITHEDRVLLGSNVLWETGRFSLLAGFVEAGETLENAVAREVFEEAGVRVGEIRYVASQPWPFPRSLMLGFHASLAADQDPEQLAADPAEISELRWFTREEIRSPHSGIKLPGELSIAGWLLHSWAAEADQ
ncbi:NAD(+) diphosphatase [Leucobacter albus]|uniref:NAD(+) diphosphatase n=1 Tax=Leucobacter albus TaxID=272210 RepID=A0ABW3TI54_9MICO